MGGTTAKSSFCRNIGYMRITRRSMDFCATKGHWKLIFQRKQRGSRGFPPWRIRAVLVSPIHDLFSFAYTTFLYRYNHGFCAIFIRVKKNPGIRPHPFPLPSFLSLLRQSSAGTFSFETSLKMVRGFVIPVLGYIQRRERWVMIICHPLIFFFYFLFFFFFLFILSLF